MAQKVKRLDVTQGKLIPGEQPSVGSLSLTFTSNTDTTHLSIEPIPNIVLIIRTRLPLGSYMSTLPKSTDFHYSRCVMIPIENYSSIE